MCKGYFIGNCVFEGCNLNNYTTYLNISEGYVLFSNIPAWEPYEKYETFINTPVTETNLVLQNNIIKDMFSSRYKNCQNSGSWLFLLEYFVDTLDDFNPNDMKTDFVFTYNFMWFDSQPEAAAVLFRNFSGSFKMENCSFQNISGFGGSAINLKNTSDFADIEIINNTLNYTFSHNFHSAICIRKQQYYYYENYKCPTIKFFENTIINNGRCKVSYQTVSFLCSLI